MWSGWLKPVFYFLFFLGGGADYTLKRRARSREILVLKKASHPWQQDLRKMYRSTRDNGRFSF
ncbi:unnamed protein product [Ectocarpus sp. 8 AP-2014]